MKKKTLLLVATCALVLTACGTTENTISNDQTSEVQSEDIISADVQDVEPDEETTSENEAETTPTETTLTETPSTEASISSVVVEDEAAVETFYSAATTLSDVEVESYATDVKDMILNGDWETFVNEISYPIIVDGLTMEDASDLTDYIADSKVSADFLAAIEAETCVAMFNSEQGITLGEEGQIWLGAVQNADGGFELKVVEINNMFEQ